MLKKLWWEIVALWWAVWAMYKAMRWRSMGIPQVEVERMVKEHMAEVLEARRAAGA